MIQGKEGLLGLFLIIMGLSMLMMCLVYYKTKVMKYSWMAFGILYVLGMLMLITDNPIKGCLNVSSGSNFYSLPSLIVLILGIMLSFVFLSKKGERYVITGILFSVGIHFLLFYSIYATILGISVCLNAIYSFVRKESSIYKTLLIDALLKLAMGVFLIFI